MAGVRETALVLLKGVYDKTSGNVQKLIEGEEVVEKLRVDKDAAEAGLNYLIDQGLLRDARIVSDRYPLVFITGSGVNAIEESLHYPRRATQYFPAAYNVINIGTMSGGSIQQGTIASVQNTQTITGTDMVKLAAELPKLLEALKSAATSPEHYVAMGQIASAELAARKSDASGVREALTKLGPTAGKWVLSAAEKIGVGVAIAAVKGYLGL